MYGVYTNPIYATSFTWYEGLLIPSLTCHHNWMTVCQSVPYYFTNTPFQLAAC